MEARLHSCGSAIQDAGERDVLEDLVRAIETDIIPRLALLHRTPDRRAETATDRRPQQVARPRAARRLDAADIDAFVRLTMGPDEGAAERHVGDLMAEGAAPEAIILDLMAPAARAIGTLWEEDRASFVAVSAAVSRLQRLLARLDGDLAMIGATRPSAGHTVLLMALPGEAHTFGLSMVRAFLTAAGFEVADDMPTTLTEAQTLVATRHFDIIGLSIGDSARIDEARGIVLSLRKISRNHSVKLIVGGAATLDCHDLQTSICADARACDAREAVVIARALVEQAAEHRPH